MFGTASASVSFVDPSEVATILKAQREEQHDEDLGGRRIPVSRILDVRDEDFVGGHIKGCIHIPCWDILTPGQRISPEDGSACGGATEHHEPAGLLSTSSPLDMFIHTYCRKDSTERIICHCYLSQQRGPLVARRLAERLGQIQSEGEEMYIAPDNVCVLKHGWRRFVALYGDDEELVEDVM